MQVQHLITNIPIKIMILHEYMNIQFISLILYNTKFYLRNIAQKNNNNNW